MSTHNRRLIGLGTLSLVVIFLLVVQESIAKKDDDEQGEAETAKIAKIICTPDNSHDEKWFKCIMCCQGINAYHLKSPDADINAEARSRFCGTKDLNSDTRVETCLGAQKFGLTLKEVTIELKGELKDHCKTSEGTQAVFKNKMDCFQACGDKNYDDPSIKSNCPNFG